MESWRRTSIVVLAIALVVVAAGEEKAIDKEACREQRLGMATCLPYLKGHARSPTPDCCSGLKQILNSDKNCMCVIIQDRNDPELGLQNKINNSLAFTLPSICHVTVNVTKCPALLHLDPNSPEAQVFYEIANAINKTTPASAPTGSTPDPTSRSDHINNSGRIPTSLPGTNDAQCFRNRWLRLEVVVHFFVILYIFSY